MGNTNYLKRKNIEEAIELLKKGDQSKLGTIVGFLGEMLNTFNSNEQEKIKAIEWEIKETGKELHIRFDKTASLDGSVCKTYGETMKLINEKQTVIHTTLTTFASTRYMEEGYKLFIHPCSNAKPFEIKYGTGNRGTNRQINPVHNIEGLLLAGEFGDDVVE